MTIHYCLMNPAGNITLLIQEPPAGTDKKALADALMAEHPAAEQAGFLGYHREDEPYLHMVGGEFCGNAAMSAAAFICRAEGLEPGCGSMLMLEVSGADEPVETAVSAREDGSWFCTAQLPPVSAHGMRDFVWGDRILKLPVFSCGGIRHLITEEKWEKEMAEGAVKRWCGELGTPALGIMFLDREKETLKPLVYVPGADTLYWEGSCASGSAAAGVFLAQEKGSFVRLKLRQPAGTLGAAARPDGTVRLSAAVTVMEMGAFEWNGEKGNGKNGD